MKFLINPVTQFEQNCSLVICEQTNQSAFIDPGGDVDKLIEVLETSNSNLSKILITHGHIDHCGIASDLHKKLSVPIIGPHQDDEFWIKQIPEQAKVFGFDELNSFVPDIWLNDNDTVKVGNIEFSVIHCPGHTPGHVVFYENLSKTAFVGDVILYNFFDKNFHIVFLKIFNLGKPEILNINFVLKLKIISRNSGKDVIK